MDTQLYTDDRQISELVEQNVRYVKDFKEGVDFCDICPMLKYPNVMNQLTQWFAYKLKDIQYDYIAGIESRGFIFAPLIAYYSGKGFIPIRKKGKLPGKKVELSYDLEYGSDTIEIQADAIEKGSKVVILDDLIATGGTAKAAADLIQKVEGIVCAYIFVIELKGLEGRKKFDPQVPLIIAHSYLK